LVFAVTFAMVLIFKPTAHTAGELSQLQKGMTPAEVRQILGEPKISQGSVITPNAAEETWTYSLPASRWSVTTEEYQLKFYEGTLDSWWKVK